MTYSQFKNIVIHPLVLSVLLIAGDVLLFTGNSLTAAGPRKDVINPHWTGKHCQECHVKQDPKQEGAYLQFGGDPDKLCVRCHSTAFVSEEIHPVNMEPVPGKGTNVPSSWPLAGGKLTCFTCHDTPLQMYVNFPVTRANPNFLRNAPYKKMTDFCFACHKKDRYQKINPHKQRDAAGGILGKTCSMCHGTVPDARKVKGISEVSFSEAPEQLCSGCHPQQTTMHPARAAHRIMPDDMKKILQDNIQALKVYLPLAGDRIFCGTCHNPHDKGIIERKEAQHGAGENYFLRLNGTYDLCITCHAEKRIQGKRRTAQPVPYRHATVQEAASFHKPFVENRCKACHAVSAGNREKPEAMFICFKEGCHKPEIVEKPFAHNQSVLDNCYLCHTSHQAAYSKLLGVNEETRCRMCHPLIRSKTGSAPADRKRPKLLKEHQLFAAYLETAAVPGGNECWFCHSPKHKEKLRDMDAAVCSDCHEYVQGVLARASASPANVHLTFKEKPCSKCHDPHAGPYQYQLKKPREAYLK